MNLSGQAPRRWLQEQRQNQAASANATIFAIFHLLGAPVFVQNLTSRASNQEAKLSTFRPGQCWCAKEVPNMYNLTFEFSLEKLVRSIAFFSKQGVPDLTKLKIIKLLYFADKHHLLLHGKPIIGDAYFCMEWGPVPSYSLNEINAALSKPEVPLFDKSDVNLFSKVLNIKKHFYQNHPRFEAKEEEFSTSVFTQSELDSLAHTANVYGYKTAKELVDLTHQEPTWVISNQGRKQGSNTPITYDLFFEGAPEKSRRILGKLVAEQFGAVIPFAGDAEYAAFANELSDYSFQPDDISESDVRSRSKYGRA